MFSSSFFDAELVGGAYDRVYAASNFAEYFASFIANGVFPDPATNLQVVANTTTNMTVLASAGLGWINGYYCKNSNPYPIAIAAASGSQARIDSIMLRWDKAARNITAYVKMGTPSANPQPPTVERTPDVYELMLATVLVGAGVTKITQANITDKRADKAVCGWVSGVVDQIDATNLFAQYDNAFKVWFKDIQDQLSGDVATNLQNQINALKTDKLAIANKATKAEAEGGTDDTKWMTPIKVSQSINSAKPVGSMEKSILDLETISGGKYLLCDGREISKENYPVVFSASPNYVKDNFAEPLISDKQPFSDEVSSIAAATFASRGVFVCSDSRVVYTNIDGTSITLLTASAKCICVSEDGSLLFVGCNDGYVRVFDSTFSKLREVKATGYHIERIVSVGLGVYFAYSHSTNDGAGGAIRWDRTSNNFISVSNCISSEYPAQQESNHTHRQLMVRVDSTTLFTCIPQSSYSGSSEWKKYYWWIYKSTDNGYTFTKHPKPIETSWFTAYGSLANSSEACCYYMGGELRIVTSVDIVCYNPTTMERLRTIGLPAANYTEAGIIPGVVFNGKLIAVGVFKPNGSASAKPYLLITNQDWTKWSIQEEYGLDRYSVRYSVVDGVLILSGIGLYWDTTHTENNPSPGRFYTTKDLVNFKMNTSLVTINSSWSRVGCGVFTKVSDFMTSIGDVPYMSTNNKYSQITLRLDTTKVKIPTEQLAYLKVKAV